MQLLEAYPRAMASARHFFRDRAGVTVVMTALLTPIMIGFVGLGIDATMWYNHKRSLQSAADAAALSAALTYLQSQSSSSARSAASGDAVRNGFDLAAGVATVNIPPLSGSSTGDATAAEVILEAPQQLYFAALFVDGPVTVAARAVASAAPGDGEHCIVALDPELDRAVEISGNADADIGCGVAANSVSESAVFVGGDAVLTANPVDAAGDILVQGGATLDTIDPPRLGETVPDPYAYLEVPTSPADCDFNNFRANQNGTQVDPGRYCGGIRVTSAQNVRFRSGVYILDGGDFVITGNSSVSGTDVTFVFTGSGNNYGGIQFAGGTEADLSAPTSGTYAGILFFQDPDAPSYQGNTLISNKILGGTGADFRGAIYFPSQEVQFTGGADVGGTGCLQLVARKVTITGSAKIGNDCADAGTRQINRMVARLVE